MQEMKQKMVENLALEVMVEGLANLHLFHFQKFHLRVLSFYLVCLLYQRLSLILLSKAMYVIS